jgi:gamma-glutamyltranspeptidase/glutathione hydrolase
VTRVATEVLDHSGQAHRGLITYEDLAGYSTRIEEPATVDYRGYPGL